MISRNLQRTDKVFKLDVKVSSYVYNYDMRTIALAAGWNGFSPLKMTVTVANGGVIGSTSYLTYAFTTNNTGIMPVNSTLALVIKSGGYVVGMGGKGENPTYPGTVGGPAIQMTYPLSITNYGVIGGGGGGGGHGAYQGFNGSGGGGAGSTGGPGGQTNGVYLAGSPGTLTTGGGAQPYGANGGFLGMHGVAGFSGSAGTAAGFATSGSATYANWIVTGNRYGTIG